MAECSIASFPKYLLIQLASVYRPAVSYYSLRFRQPRDEPPHIQSLWLQPAV